MPHRVVGVGVSRDPRPSTTTPRGPGDREPAGAEPIAVRDVLLYALGQEVARKQLTSEQAREIYARHYGKKDTYEIQPEDLEAEKVAHWKDWQKYYASREELEEYIETAFGEYGNFPSNEELDYLPNSMDFWEEADGLRLDGVGLSNDISPASGPVFLVDNDDALGALKKAYEGRYG